MNPAEFDYGIREHITQSPPNVLRELIQVSLDRSDLISFAGGLPANELFDVEGLQTASEQVFRSNSRAPFQYNSNEGLLTLRNRLAELCKGRGISADPRHMIATSGSQQAIDLVTRCLIEPGDVVIVERPTFITALQTFRAAQAKIVGVDSDGEGPALDGLEAALHAAKAAGRRVKFMYLVPTFANPTGRIMSLERRHAIIGFAVRHGIVILEDDPYGELWFDEPPPPALRALADPNPEAASHILYVSSLSKTVSPGVRVGWLVLPATLMTPFKHMKATADIHSSLFSQAVMEAYLGMQRLPKRIEMAKHAYRGKANVLISMLQKHAGPSFSFEMPAGGMFIWAKLHVPGTSLDFARFVLDHNVSVVPGEPFFAHDPETHWLRLSFTQGRHQEIETGAKGLVKAIAAWKDSQ